MHDERLPRVEDCGPHYIPPRLWSDETPAAPGLYWAVVAGTGQVEPVWASWTTNVLPGDPQPSLIFTIVGLPEAGTQQPSRWELWLASVPPLAPLTRMKRPGRTRRRPVFPYADVTRPLDGCCGLDWRVEAQRMRQEQELRQKLDQQAQEQMQQAQAAEAGQTVETDTGPCQDGASEEAFKSKLDALLERLPPGVARAGKFHRRKPKTRLDSYPNVPRLIAALHEVIPDSTRLMAGLLGYSGWADCTPKEIIQIADVLVDYILSSGPDEANACLQTFKTKQPTMHALLVTRMDVRLDGKKAQTKEEAPAEAPPYAFSFAGD